ncbi:MAG: GNAT family N-acetyltransferase [Pseudomonadota bacterium]
MIDDGWRPGLIGEVIRHHGEFYAREWQFTGFFEAKVAGELAEFMQRYDATRDAIFSTYEDNTFLASVTIDGSDAALPDQTAHLRWFIASDASRGRGVGRALFAHAIGFVRSVGYERCYLTTFAGLDEARHLYERAGFKLVSEADAESWGTRVREQRFEWGAERASAI